MLAQDNHAFLLKIPDATSALKNRDHQLLNAKHRMMRVKSYLRSRQWQKPFLCWCYWKSCTLQLYWEWKKLFNIAHDREITSVACSFTLRLYYPENQHLSRSKVFRVIKMILLQLWSVLNVKCPEMSSYTLTIETSLLINEWPPDWMKPYQIIGYLTYSLIRIFSLGCHLLTATQNWKCLRGRSQLTPNNFPILWA